VQPLRDVTSVPGPVAAFTVVSRETRQLLANNAATGLGLTIVPSHERLFATHPRRVLVARHATIGRGDRYDVLRFPRAPTLLHAARAANGSLAPVRAVAASPVADRRVERGGRSRLSPRKLASSTREPRYTR